jgi:hypothetical protein
MKLPSIKLVALAFVANIAPLATGIVQILLGNIPTGIGAIAGGIGAMAAQVMNAQAEAQQTRSQITVAWFFSRVYVWLTIAIGIVVLLVLFGKYL